MPEYDRFSRFYDAAMDDPGPRADYVSGCIDRYLPAATSLLELGCGTGSILARLTSPTSLTGLDRSTGMLEVARGKVPGARLLEGDMQCFSLGERFDVVISVFDSLNHLLTFDAWQSMFDAVHEHLVDGGLFVFDVNTLGEIRRLGDEPPWVDDFDSGVLIMDVSFAEDESPDLTSQWDIRIFEHVGSSRFDLHHEVIGELGVSLERVKGALEPKFALLEETDENGNTPTDESVKAHFAYRRVP